MSQEEFDQQDKQVIDMVENHAHPDAKKAADDICKREQGAVREPQITTPLPAEQNESNGGTAAAELRRHLRVGLQVVICAIIASLFLAALRDKNFVVYLVNLGILSCGVTAAIIVDRHIRR